IPDFQGGSQDEVEKGRTVAQVIVADLRTSGRFAPLDPGLYAGKMFKVDTMPQFTDWRVIGTEYLVIGQLALRSNEHIKVGFRLWDIVAGQQIVAVQYSVTSDHLHRIPHVIADAVYGRLTGQVGPVR